MKKKHLFLSGAALLATGLTVGVLAGMPKAQEAPGNEIVYGELTNKSRLPKRLTNVAPKNISNGLCSSLFKQVSDEYDNAQGIKCRAIRFVVAFHSDDMDTSVWDVACNWKIEYFDKLTNNLIKSINAKSENSYDKIVDGDKTYLPSDDLFGVGNDYNQFATYAIRDIPVSVYDTTEFVATLKVDGEKTQSVPIGEKTNEVGIVERTPVAEYGFADSYEYEGNWVHEISNAEEFGRIISLGAEQGGGDKDTTYLITEDLSFDNKTPWEAMNVTAQDWTAYNFTGKIIGEDGQKIIGDSIMDSAKVASLPTKDLIGGLFCKTKDVTVENIEFSNFNIDQGASALQYTGLVFGGFNDTGNSHLYDVVINNVIIDSDCSIVGAKNIGAMFGSARYLNSVTATNYTNNANVKSTGYSAGGFAGTATGLKEATFVNCVNNGTITGNEGRAAGFIGAISGVGNGSTQTVKGGFKFVNCASNGSLYDYTTKPAQGGGYFVGLQAATDKDAYSNECENCTVAGYLYTNISANGNYTLAYERTATWIKNVTALNELVLSSKLEKLNLALNYQTHKMTIEQSDLQIDHYTLTIRLDGYDAIPDVTTKSLYVPEAGGKIHNILSSKVFTSEEDFETNARMLSRVGYFMPTIGGVTIDHGDVSRYANQTAMKFQEFVIDSSKRGTTGYTEALSDAEDGGLAFIAMNDSLDENGRFTVFSRMGTRVHYIISGFDSSGNMIAHDEISYGIFHISDEYCNSVLPFGVSSYTFYRNFAW